MYIIFILVFTFLFIRHFIWNESHDDSYYFRLSRKFVVGSFAFLNKVGYLQFAIDSRFLRDDLVLSVWCKVGRRWRLWRNVLMNIWKVEKLYFWKLKLPAQLGWKILKVCEFEIWKILFMQPNFFNKILINVLMWYQNWEI